MEKRKILKKLGTDIVKNENFLVKLCALILFVFMAGFAFLPIYSSDTKKSGAFGSGMLDTFKYSKIYISICELIEATTVPSDYSQDDYYAETHIKLDRISNATKTAISNGEELSKIQQQELDNALSEINPFKLYFSSDAKEVFSPARIALYITLAAAVLTFLSSLGFAVLILLALLGKIKSFRFLNYAFLLPLSLSLVHIVLCSQSVYYGFMLSGGVIVPLVLSLVGILMIAANTLIVRKTQNDQTATGATRQKLELKPLLLKAGSIVTSLVLLCILSANFVRVEATYPYNVMSLSVSYDRVANIQIKGTDWMQIASDYDQRLIDPTSDSYFVDKTQRYDDIEYIINKYGEQSPIVQNAVVSLFYAEGINSKGALVMPIFFGLSALALIAVVAYMTYCILANKKLKKLALLISFGTVALSALVCLIAAAALCAQFNSVYPLMLVAKLSGGLIAFATIAILAACAAAVFFVLERKRKKKTEQPQVDPKIEQPQAANN